MTAELLLVEDDEHIAQGLVYNLQRQGYRVQHALDGAAAEAALAGGNFQLVVLDRMLPDADGADLCRQWRQRFPGLPILMLTALGKEDDRIAGLQQGADDYVTKPFSLAEFLLRVQALLRRSQAQPHESSRWYRFGKNHLDLQEGRAYTAQGEIQLTELEQRIVKTFIRHAGQTLSRKELLELVLGMNPDTETRTLDNFIVRLRRYFEADPARPCHFVTVRRRGYRFEPQG